MTQVRYPPPPFFFIPGLSNHYCFLFLFFSFEMVQTLNEQPHITFDAVEASIFFNYGELLDNFYKPFQAGAVQGNHVFWVESTNPAVMFTKETAEEPTIPI
jgi:hypothetical protein